MDERTLVEQLKQGDETAFKTIVETWQNMVYNTALGIVQNAEDAEDIAQETFVQVYRSIGSFRGIQILDLVIPNNYSQSLRS